MKSYHQYCSVARALDLVGDRWVLLIVRELFVLGPSRYSDLKRGLPGIASNLLAERLKTMEADGLIERREAPAPIGAGLYQLTQRGRDLDDVLRSLSRWGLPTMPSGPSPEDSVQPQWSALLAGLTLTGKVLVEDQAIIGIETGSESVRVVLRHDGFEVERGLGTDAEVTLRGSALVIGGVLARLLTITEATRLGLTIEGRAHLLAELVDDHHTRTGAGS